MVKGQYLILSQDRLGFTPVIFEDRVMSSRVLTFVAMTVVPVVASLCVAADEALKSGPQPGTEDKPVLVPGAFQVLSVVHADIERSNKTVYSPVGKFHCPVCEHGLNPVVLIFSRTIPEPDKPGPLTQLLTKLEEMTIQRRDAQ